VAITDDDGEPIHIGFGQPPDTNKSTHGPANDQVPPKQPAKQVAQTHTFSGEKCYVSHKPLVVTKAGGLIYGGSCYTPVVNDADMYIGFDGGMSRTPMRFPWNPGEEIVFPVQDMQSPQDATNYIKLVKWTLAQIDAGKKVHCGCIGGHGRTGMFMAALVRVGLGIEDAVPHVRSLYCERAVETAGQSLWLQDTFGIKIAKGYKQYDAQKPKFTQYKGEVEEWGPAGGYKNAKQRKKHAKGGQSPGFSMLMDGVKEVDQGLSPRDIKPMTSSQLSIWS
jgi:hypothetical protein